MRPFPLGQQQTVNATLKDCATMTIREAGQACPWAGQPDCAGK